MLFGVGHFCPNDIFCFYGKKVVFISTFAFFKSGHFMVIIIDFKDKRVIKYPTLTKACLNEQWMNYNYLKGIKLNDTFFPYKGYAICKL